MPLSPVAVPAQDEHDVQLDGNLSGEVLGPTIHAGNVRYRRGVDDGVAVTADVGFARAREDEPSSANPWAGLARAGVQIAGEATDELDVAAFAGFGGGIAPAAGKWVSGDVGAMISGDHRYVRPIIVGDVYASQPFATRTFEVGDVMLELPRTVGVQGLAGFDLGPRDRSFMVGFALAQLWAAPTKHDTAQSAMFVGLGAGFRFAPD